MGFLSWIFSLAVIGAVVYTVWLFNLLVRGRNQVREAWSDVETQLKRRYDLIPNLVEAVRGYAKHESATLEKIVAARSAAMNRAGRAGEPESRIDAENDLSRTLKSIFALSESYPELKASQNFIELQKEISDTEDKIQASRRFYNSIALSFNNRADTFPNLLISPLLGFGKIAFFELDEGERAFASRPVQVQF